MKEKIIIAIITALLTILATWIGRLPVENWLSFRMRRQSNIPEIMNTEWKTEWSYDDGSPSVKDTVTFSKWTKYNLFEGFGEVIHDKLYKYSITGEVSPARIVVLTYKAERYPTEANIGTASLLLSSNAQELAGIWVGFEAIKQPDGAEVFKLRGGRITMHRVRG